MFSKFKNNWNATPRNVRVNQMQHVIMLVTLTVLLVATAIIFVYVDEHGSPFI